MKYNSCNLHLLGLDWGTLKDKKLLGLFSDSKVIVTVKLYFLQQINEIYHNDYLFQDITRTELQIHSNLIQRILANLTHWTLLFSEDNFESEIDTVILESHSLLILYLHN